MGSPEIQMYYIAQGSKSSGVTLITFLYISLNINFEYSKEPSHLDDSFDYPQYTFLLKNTKIIFHLPPQIWGPDIGKLMQEIYHNQIFD